MWPSKILIISTWWGSESKMRASTENLISIVGMATALQQATIKKKISTSSWPRNWVNGLLRLLRKYLPFVWNLGPCVQNDIDDLDLLEFRLYRVLLCNRRYHSTCAMSLMGALWKDSRPKRIPFELVFQNSIP